MCVCVLGFHKWGYPKNMDGVFNGKSFEINDIGVPPFQGNQCKYTYTCSKPWLVDDYSYRYRRLHYPTKQRIPNQTI